MNLSDLKAIISRGEDSRHQFKEDIRNGDSLAAEMTAFSNSRGGYIFIGVSNKGDLVGLSSKDVGGADKRRIHSNELLVTKLGKDRTTIMRNIEKMKDGGILKRLEPRKTGYWEIL